MTVKELQNLPEGILVKICGCGYNQIHAFRKLNLFVSNTTGATMYMLGSIALNACHIKLVNEIEITEYYTKRMLELEKNLKEKKGILKEYESNM